MDTQSIGAAKGPYPVTEYRADGTTLILGSAPTISDGVSMLAKLVKDWEASKPSQPHRQRKAVKDDAFTVTLYFSDGKLRATVCLDPVPVPRDAASPGDILVDRPGLK